MASPSQPAEQNERRDGAEVAAGWPAILVAVLFAAASAFLFDRIFGPIVLHVDTAKDLALARDCAPLGACHSEVVGYPGLMKGTTFLRLLSACFALGAEVGGIRLFVIITHALAVGLVGLTAARIYGWWRGVLALLVFAMLLVGDPTTRVMTLWNPTFVPVATAACFSAFFWAFRRGGHARWAVAAVLFAIAADVHVMCLGLLPVFVLFAAGSAGARVLERLWILAVALLGTFVLLSAEEWDFDLRAFGALAGTGLAAVVVALVALRRLWPAGWRRFLALAGTRRAWLPTLAWLVMYGLVASAVFLGGRSFDDRYLLPVFPLVALGTVALSAVPRGRAPAVARVSAIAAFALVVGVVSYHMTNGLRLHLQDPERSTRWSTADAEAVARSLEARGYSFSAAARGLVGATRSDVIVGMGPFFGLEPAPARRQPAPDTLIAVVRLPADRLPASRPERWTVIRLERHAVALLRDYRSWLDWSRVELCVSGVDADPGRDDCVPLDLTARWQRTDAEPRRFFDRSFPPPEPWYLLDGPEGQGAGLYRRLRGLEQLREAFVLRFRVRVAIPEGATATNLWVERTRWGDGRSLRPARRPACSWTVEAVRGVGVAGPLPSPGVRLTAGAAREGLLTLAVRCERTPNGASTLRGGLLPVVVPYEDDEVALLTALGVPAEGAPQR